MVQRLIGQYFARARTVAQTIGIDAYFIDERSGRVVRLEPNGTSHFSDLSTTYRTEYLPA